MTSTDNKPSEGSKELSKLVDDIFETIFVDDTAILTDLPQIPQLKRTMVALVKAEIRKTLERLKEQATPKLGDFDITYEEYPGAVKTIEWYKSAIDYEIKSLEDK